MYDDTVLVDDEAKNPNTLKAKKWYGEYCAARSWKARLECM